VDMDSNQVQRLGLRVRRPDVQLQAPRADQHRRVGALPWPVTVKGEVCVGRLSTVYGLVNGLTDSLGLCTEDVIGCWTSHSTRKRSCSSARVGSEHRAEMRCRPTGAAARPSPPRTTHLCRAPSSSSSASTAASRYSLDG
jgi:hypothetical protein